MGHRLWLLYDDSNVMTSNIYYEIDFSENGLDELNNCWTEKDCRCLLLKEFISNIRYATYYVTSLVYDIPHLLSSNIKTYKIIFEMMKSFHYVPAKKLLEPNQNQPIEWPNKQFAIECSPKLLFIFSRSNII